MTVRTLVTGAAGALGHTVRTTLETAGHTVIGLDIGEVAGTGHYSNIDLTDSAAVAKVADEIVSTGGVTNIVNVAGAFVWEPTLVENAADTWERMWKINFQTAFNISTALAPHLPNNEGNMVFIGAAAAARASAGMGAYAASKSAVARLAEALSEELKEKRIRVNAILPSIVDTPANRRDMPDADFENWVTSTEIADVIAFLLSPAASGITGAAIPVTGRV